MRDVQSLRPAPVSDSSSLTARPAWGTPGRFVVAGLVIVLLAAIVAIILCTQFPAHFGGLPSPEAVRERVKGMPTLATMKYFHQWILPGIDIREQAGSERRRKMVYLGMASVAGVGAIGLILVGIGLVGVVRRR